MVAAEWDEYNRRREFTRLVWFILYKIFCFLHCLYLLIRESYARYQAQQTGAGPQSENYIRNLFTKKCPGDTDDISLHGASNPRNTALPNESEKLVISAEYPASKQTCRGESQRPTAHSRIIRSSPFQRRKNICQRREQHPVQPFIQDTQVVLITKWFRIVLLVTDNASSVETQNTHNALRVTIPVSKFMKFVLPLLKNTKVAKGRNTSKQKKKDKREHDQNQNANFGQDRSVPRQPTMEHQRSATVDNQCNCSNSKPVQNELSIANDNPTQEHKTVSEQKLPDTPFQEESPNFPKGDSAEREHVPTMSSFCTDTAHPSSKEPARIVQEHQKHISNSSANATDCSLKVPNTTMPKHDLNRHQKLEDVRSPRGHAIKESQNVTNDNAQDQIELEEPHEKGTKDKSTKAQRDVQLGKRRSFHCNPDFNEQESDDVAKTKTLDQGKEDQKRMVYAEESTSALLTPTVVMPVTLQYQLSSDKELHRKKTVKETPKANKEFSAKGHEATENSTRTADISDLGVDLHSNASKRPSQASSSADPPCPKANNFPQQKPGSTESGWKDLLTKSTKSSNAETAEIASSPSARGQKMPADKHFTNHEERKEDSRRNSNHDKTKMHTQEQNDDTVVTKMDASGHPREFED